FWNTAVVKRSGDVTRLQALVNKKRTVIIKEVVHEILQLNDAEGVICLPNAEIFAGLSRMGYEKPSTKLTFYKEFFLTQWKVGKGFSGVETPLFENMLAVRDVDAEEKAQVPAQGDDVQEHAIEEIATEVRNIVDMDQDEGIELVVDHEKDAEVEGRHADKQAEIYNIDLDHSSKVLSMQEDDTEVQEAVEVVTTAKLITEVVTAAATQVVAASTPIPAAKPKILKIAAAPAVSTRRRKRFVIIDPKEELHTDTPAETPTVKDKGKGILIEDLKHMKKKDQVEMDAEYAKKLQEELDKEHVEAYKNIDWNAALDHVQYKEPRYIKRYHGIKKKPQYESEARKNMISYLKNTKGYKMEFFKGKTYDQILPIFQARFDANLKFLFKSREEMEKEDEEIIKSINETPTQKAAKKRSGVRKLKKLMILRRDWRLYKMRMMMCLLKLLHLLKRFTTLLKNFDREDLETLWRIDAIWRNQKSVYGLELVKRWKLLTSCGVHVIILSTVQLFLLVKR
nr:hypothetical protein [Tanacetum cinerariifolium]